MTENLLKDLEINEGILEGALYSIGEDNDGDLVGRQLHGAKNLALKIDKLGNVGIFPTQNSFVEMKYTIVDGKAFIYPSINPSTELEIKIIGYQHVFGDKCSLVLGDYAGKQFVFFDPDSENKDYQKLLSTKQKIRLAVISSGTGYSDFEPGFRDVFDSEQLKEFLAKGYTKTRLLDSRWHTPLYRTIFEVKDLKEKQGNHFLVDVKNPLDSDRSLELVTASIELDPKNLEKIVSNFYFIGRF